MNIAAKETLFYQSDRTNNELFSQLLKSHVTEGFVDYRAFSKNIAFRNYLEYLAKKSFSLKSTPKEKLAFYINSYNALVIDSVNSGSTPSSFLGKIRFFYLNRHLVAGEQINLYDLEHKIIRSFQEERIHFALVCAAKSCPALRTEAYTVDKLDKQLEEDALRFINDSSKNRLDVRNPIDYKSHYAYISSIFKWFKNDFTRKEKLPLYLSRYIKDIEPEKQRIKRDLINNQYGIKFKKYDWSLNGFR